MTEHDYDSFMSEFRRVASAFERYPQSIDAMRARADVYFNVLKKFTLREVTAKADAWIDRESKMPKPAEWANTVVRRAASDAWPTMDDAEAREWLRAERQKWDDTPCGCAECVQAGVNEMPRRFVPVFDTDGGEVRALCFGRLVCCGEWLHGFALMRWYLARETFFTHLNRGPRKMPSASTESDSRKQRQLSARKLLSKRTPTAEEEADRTARILGERP